MQPLAYVTVEEAAEQSFVRKGSLHVAEPRSIACGTGFWAKMSSWAGRECLELRIVCRTNCEGDIESSRMSLRKHVVWLYIHAFGRNVYTTKECVSASG